MTIGMQDTTMILGLPLEGLPVSGSFIVLVGVTWWSYTLG
jgi:hypothetical protein